MSETTSKESISKHERAERDVEIAFQIAERLSTIVNTLQDGYDEHEGWSSIDDARRLTILTEAESRRAEANTRLAKFQLRLFAIEGYGTSYPTPQVDADDLAEAFGPSRPIEPRTEDPNYERLQSSELVIAESLTSKISIVDSTSHDSLNRECDARYSSCDQVIVDFRYGGMLVDHLRVRLTDKHVPVLNALLNNRSRLVHPAELEAYDPTNSDIAGLMMSRFEEVAGALNRDAIRPWIHKQEDPAGTAYFLADFVKVEPKQSAA